MVSTTTPSYLPKLPVPHEREGVARELQAVLVDLADPSLNGKQPQRAVSGRLFRVQLGERA